MSRQCNAIGGVFMALHACVLLFAGCVDSAMVICHLLVGGSVLCTSVSICLCVSYVW